MRRSTLFWGFTLIAVGVLLLLQNLGIIAADVWDLIWPVAMIAFGVWVLMGVFIRPSTATEAVAVPLEGAASARVRIKHGAGKLTLKAGSDPEVLLSGNFMGGLDYRARREGEHLDLKMRVPQGGSFPWGPRPHFDWEADLNAEVPLRLIIKCGANESKLDLTDVRLSELILKTGASRTELALPARAGQSVVDIDLGAASLDIQVPSEAAARFRIKSGATAVNVDKQRFPRRGEYYASDDYETAANKIDVRIDAGAGTLDIR